MNTYLTSLGISGATTNQVFPVPENPFGSERSIGRRGQQACRAIAAGAMDGRDTILQKPAGELLSKFWHEQSIDNKCYGFAYDDAGGQAAYTSHAALSI